MLCRHFFHLSFLWVSLTNIKTCRHLMRANFLTFFLLQLFVVFNDKQFCVSVLPFDCLLRILSFLLCLVLPSTRTFIEKICAVYEQNTFCCCSLKGGGGRQGIFYDYFRLFFSLCKNNHEFLREVWHEKMWGLLNVVNWKSSCGHFQSFSWGLNGMNVY